ncbi:uncharacterized protein LOC123510766 isoform X2 [Portunus trituberculatus]|uniref:uncharacterized protein LOC123510766 isoform X2 n=1 Tax=Portunus trituberculatus TaxID=210409 RepID=UPI001E1D0B11|nr:uncharacterized protein LOC123510766 isoform X2 [Portunus trituberculatus]
MGDFRKTTLTLTLTTLRCRRRRPRSRPASEAIRSGRKLRARYTHRSPTLRMTRSLPLTLLTQVIPRTSRWRCVCCELADAALKIQAGFRGAKARKNIKKEDADLNQKLGNLNTEEEEVDIDLTDPELNKAATKIQATFRGHKQRANP